MLDPVATPIGSDASRLKIPVLSCRRGTGESGSRTWSGTPAWTESPKGLSVGRVEGFRQVYEEGNEVYILFDALLLHLAYSEDHVGGAAVWTEFTVGFQQVFLRDVGDEAVEDDLSQDLPSDGQERDAPLVTAVSLTAPVLEQGDECGIPEFFGYILFFLDAGED